MVFNNGMTGQRQCRFSTRRGRVEALKAHRSGKGGRISAGKCFDSKSETVEEKELKRRMMGE
eukprot:909340-Amorphochlora_amoeboformis.AAC.1